MSFTIPDKGEGANDVQSILFQEYLDILVAGISGSTCVKTGCAVTAQATPDMTVAVAAGTVRSLDKDFTVAAGNGTITAADAASPRLDLVVITSAGAIAVRTGTPALNPKPAARTAGDVVLAVVYVPAADTTIENTQITSLRVVNNNITPGISGPFALRNKIINGNFDIWQRGTSFTGNDYCVDRWAIGSAGSTKTLSRQGFTMGQTDVPGEPAYYCRIAVTSVAGVSNYTQLSHKIESVRTFAGKQVTFSFWAKADAAKNMAIELVQEFGSGGTPSAVVTGIGTQLIPLTASWQKFTKTITIPSITGKTLGTNNGDNLRCNFWFDAGADYNARTASLGQQSGTFDIAQVQIEEGSIATPFEQRPIGYELSLCQRYYTRRNTIGTNASFGVGHFYTTTSFRFIFPLPVAMRATPALSHDAVANFVVQNSDVNRAISAFTFIGYSTNEIWLEATSAASVAGQAGMICNVAGSSFIALSAEL